ncbi:phosphoribosylanthranilate isomerase [Chitinivorax sp. B]|uniref:phosphoribosylanthranilate isomerase n=1 Tax=Chitinivorax sp. B TaxID=2502235 RepID=UPI0010F5C63C|nr:phosphoribosylanthranilate isomerase [Chitinivorax sp. B]
MSACKIKICGLTREQDVAVAANAGADALGFVFYPPSPRHLDVERAKVLVESVPPFVTTVGLFVNARAMEIERVLRMAPVDLLQFHGDEAPEFCGQFGRPYIKAIRVKAGLDLHEYAQQFAGARGLLLDAFVEGVPGGTGSIFDWGLIPSDLPMPIILSGGLESGNIVSAVKQVRPWAVDVSSGVESAKGIKDADKIAAFINGVRNANV